MSVAPIKVGETDKTLQGVAYVVAGGLITGVKTDLVVADIDSLYVIRDQSTAVTISSDGTGLTNKTNQNDAHSDGAVWNPGDGTLFVDCPDAAFAVYVKDVQLKGAWTDGSDSGVIRGTPVSMVNYAWKDGPSSVNVTPLTATTETRINGTTINYYVGETIAQTVAITDSAGSAVDLSGKTLQVIIDSPRPSHGDVQVIANANITVSGASSNQVTFTNSAAVTASARTLRWALRDTSNNEVLGRGQVRVTEAAEED